MKTKILVLATLVFLTFSCTPKEKSEEKSGKGGDSTEEIQKEQSNLDKYLGAYAFSESIEGGSMPMMYNHVMTIEKNGGKYTVNYDVDGYQTMTRLKCSIESNDNEHNVVFEEFGEEQIFKSGYEPGDKVVSFYDLLEEDGKTFLNVKSHSGLLGGTIEKDTEYKMEKTK